MRWGIVKREMGRSPFTSLASDPYQGDVYRPWPSNLLLTFIEEVNKFLSSIFWQGLDESGAKTVCSQPCCLVHRGRRFVQVLELNFEQVLIRLCTCPDLLGCHSCTLGRVSCLLPLSYPCLETRCHHIHWCAEVCSCGFVPILPVQRCASLAP